MNIKQLRVLRGLKQKELADKMGISAQQLNNYEGGKSNPGNKILPALADALGVSTAYLRGGRPEAGRLRLGDWMHAGAPDRVRDSDRRIWDILSRRSSGCRDHRRDPV